jgi:L-lactate permease
VPLITVLVLLGVFRWKAQWTGLAALLVSLAVALFAYGMPAGQVLGAAGFGAASSVPAVLWITFNAIWIYNLTVETGHFAVLRRAFAAISDDRRIQAIGTAAVGAVGAEGTLFRKVFGWSVVMLALLCLLVYLQSTPVLGWTVVG